MPSRPSPLLRPRTASWLLLILLWVTVASALWTVREVLLPFAVAALLAYVLHPAVTRMSAWKVRGTPVPRWAATLGIYALLLGGGWATSAVFVPQVRDEISAFTRNARATSRDADELLTDWTAELNAAFVRWGVPLDVSWREPQEGPPQRSEGAVAHVNLKKELMEAAESLEELAKGVVGAVAQRAQGFVGAVVGFVFRFFLVLMLAAFILADVKKLRETVLSMVPLSRRAGADRILDDMDEGLSGVVRGQLTICAVNAVLTLVGLLLLKVKFAFLLALMAGVFSLIPIFGSIVSSIPIVAVALTDDLQKAVLALLWIVGIHALEANLLNPKIMGSAARIHPVLVVLVLVAGEHFYGFTGALFAVPVLSVGLTLFKAIHARAVRLQQVDGAVEEPANADAAAPREETAAP